MKHSTKLALALLAAGGASLAYAVRALVRTPDVDRRRAYPGQPERWAGIDGRPAPLSNALRSTLFYSSGAAAALATLGGGSALGFTRSRLGLAFAAALAGTGAAVASARAMLAHGPGAMDPFEPTSKLRLGARPRVLFICGSPNQTTQMHQIAAALPEVEAWFTFFFSDHWPTRTALKLGFIESTIAGHRRRGICLDYLNAHGLRVDFCGEQNEYDAIVSCSDQLLPSLLDSTPWVLVQEGIQEPPNWRTAIWMALRACGMERVFPAPLAGTAAFGLSNAYAKFCVASEGYRAHYVRQGIPEGKLVTTGIPNFDDFRRYVASDFPYRGYVLVCTSDARETWLAADRGAIFAKALAIAGRRPIFFKLHPNENVERASAEIRARVPAAKIFASGSAEVMVAHCDVLLTEYSSLTFCGLALGKEVYSLHSLQEARELLPVQNGRAAELIADVVRGVLDLKPRHPLPSFDQMVLSK